MILRGNASLAQWRSSQRIWPHVHSGEEVAVGSGRVNDRYGASACGAAIRPGGPKLADSRLSRCNMVAQCSERQEPTPFGQSRRRRPAAASQQQRSFSSSHLTGTIGEIQTVVPVSRATDSRYLTVIVGGLDLTNSQTYKSCVE